MNTTINIPLAAKYNLYTIKYWLCSFGVENIIFLKNLLLLVPLSTSIFSFINSHDLVFVQIPLTVLVCHPFPFLTSSFLYLVPSHCFVFSISIFSYFPFYVFIHPYATTVSVPVIIIFIISSYMWVHGGRITPEPLHVSLPCQSLQCGSHGDQEDPGLQITQAGPASWNRLFSEKFF